MNDSTALAKYDPAKVNMLVPAQQIQQLNPWYAARVTLVKVDPDPTSGDVHDVGSSKRKVGNKEVWVRHLAPAKPALMRMSQAAGIAWNWRESGPEVVERMYVRYKAVCAVRMPDGSYQPYVGTYELDLEVIEEIVRERVEGYRDITPEEVEQKVKSEMLQWRKNKLARAETGAMLRAIRGALGLRPHYTAEELQKPFAVPRIDLQPDYSDPNVQRVLLEQGMRGAQALFGGHVSQGSGQVIEAPSIRPAIQGPEDDDVFDVPGGGAWDEDTGGDERGFNHDLQDDEDLPPLPDEPPAAEEWGGQQEPPTQSAPAQGGQQAPPQEGATGCTDCGTVIESEKVVAYSRRTYGTELCYSCQQKRKAGGQ